VLYSTRPTEKYRENKLVNLLRRNVSRVARESAGRLHYQILVRKTTGYMN